MVLTIKRSLKSALSNIGRQKSISFAIISILVVFFMITNFLASSYYVISKISSYLETKPNISVWIAIGTDEDKIAELKKRIESTGKTSEVTYFSEIDSANDFLNIFKDQPLYTSTITPNEPGQLQARLNIKPLKIEYVADLKQLLDVEQQRGNIIDEVYADIFLANRLNDLLNIIRFVVVAFVVVFVAVLVSMNLLSIQFSMRNRSEEIKVMQLVGASKGLIRMPFIFEGATLGFFASLITALLCLLAFVGLTAINNYSPTFKTFVALFSEVRWPVIGVKYALMYVFAQLSVGTLVGAFSNFLAVRKYIK
jgi:cell division transport system permease protein